MKLNDYQIESRRTAVYLENLGQNLWYPALKLAGEVSELVQEITNGSETPVILKEAGDVLWYMAAICSEMKVELQQVANKAIAVELSDLFPGSYLLVAVGKISESVGKAYRDFGGSPNQHQKQIIHELSIVCFWLNRVAKEHGSTIEEVADLNLAKLRDRQERGVLHGSGNDR